MGAPKVIRFVFGSLRSCLHLLLDQDPDPQEGNHQTLISFLNTRVASVRPSDGEDKHEQRLGPEDSRPPPPSEGPPGSRPRSTGRG